MKIEFIFFHGQLSGLLHPATGKFHLVMRKKGVAGQLPRLYFAPGAAVGAPGLIPAGHYSYPGHGSIPISLRGQGIRGLHLAKQRAFR